MSDPLTAPSWWQRVRSHKWASRALDVAAFAAIILTIFAWNSKDLPSGGEPAAAFSLETIDGGDLALDDLRGQKTMLVFWAPWCPVCGAESDNVSRVQQ